jgi:hypothetical protein
MRIKIEISGNTRWQGEIDDSRQWLEADYIENYQYARNWRLVERTPERGISWDSTQFWYRVDLNGSGNYSLGEKVWETLPAWAESGSLRLFSLEKQEKFYRAEEIELYTEANETGFSYYGKNSVLWLAVGGTFPENPHRTEIKEARVATIESVKAYIPESRIRDREIACLLIRPTDFFETAAEELSEIHLEYFGIETAVAIQEDIFAIESGGVADPSAIQSYLMEYKENNPTLEYVVLMGSGTSNFDNPAGKNKIIAWNQGGITSDDHFVDLYYDSHPDISIGRIPAQTENMMSNYLQRIRDYYDNPDLGWWQNRLLLIADDENKSGGLEGTGSSSFMNHTGLMEDAAEEVPGRNFEKVYGLEYPFDSYQNKPGAGVDIIKALDEGCLLMYYIGHGSWNTLGDEDYFTSEMIQQLNNYEHLTQLIAGSCNVGNFDHLTNNCLAELILFGENGGAISSIAASDDSTPQSNSQLLAEYMNRIYNHYENTGKALLYAKNITGTISNNKKYNILGDPVLRLPVPRILGNINVSADSLQYRQTVNYQGNYELQELNVAGETVVYDSEQLVHYSNFIPPNTAIVYNVDYYRSGNAIFRGGVSLTAGEYQSTFIVPDNAGTGDRGAIITWAAEEDSAYLNVKQGIRYVDSALPVTNDAAPEINLCLDSWNFRSGDAVSEAPLLMAEIADSSGINLTVNSGKNIMILLDDSINADDLIDVSTGFIYKQGSHTRGTLNWQLPLLSKGLHNLKLIVYDNFGLATVATTDFRVIEQGSLAITDILPYPHPMSENGWFTFVLTADADVTISIYTISGRKIKTINSFCNTGYNQIFWNGRDADGDRIANNTYFYKIRAHNGEMGKTAESIEKLVMFK